MSIINVSFPVRVVATPMAGANNSTFRRDSAASATDEHETLNREVGHQIDQRRRMFDLYENILHQRSLINANYLLTISDNLMFSSSVVSALAKPLVTFSKLLNLENHNAVKQSRQKAEMFTIPYLEREQTSLSLVEAA